MTNQPYNGISMHTFVYLICVRAVLLPLVMVNSGCECKIITEQMITMTTLTDLFGNYYASARYSTFHHSIDTGSSALESCHCGGCVYFKWWHHLIIKHMWHMITVTSKIFQNPGAKTCSVIPCIDMSPCMSLSHNLCDWYQIVSQSCIDCHLNYFPIGYLFIDSVTLSVLANDMKLLLL